MTPQDYYRHDSADRLNLPTEETPADPGRVQTIRYQAPRREGTDPVLAWDRGDGGEHNGPVLSVREKVHPQAFVDQFRAGQRGTPLNLFDDYNGFPPDKDIFEHYQHRHNWQNRLIHGESARVMSSLITREQMAGRVQVVYFDPPYGIQFKSNFQVSTNSLATGDSKDYVPVGDPATVQAYRDTYNNGVHSFLDAMLERLLLIRELLADTGSMFLQIGDENVHRLALLCDEVFGPENKVATITWKPTGSSSAKMLSQTASYLLWYAKDQTRAKYHQLHEQLDRKGLIEKWGKSFSPAQMELKDKDAGNVFTRGLTAEEKQDPSRIPDGARIYQAMPLTSPNATTGGTCEYEYEGVKYHPGSTNHWRVSTPEQENPRTGYRGQRTGDKTFRGDPEGPCGLDRLAELGRLVGTGPGGSLRWKKYEEEDLGRRIDNVWHQVMSPGRNKRYVVETAASVVERCILMTSDPGDLVLDPTCGSGVTADVAERWGRRWITIDTSPVSIAIARQRLLTGVYPWWNLATEANTSDPAVGFDCQTYSTVSAGTLAYDTVNDPKNTKYHVNRPRDNRKKLRVSGPFTVETESPYSYAPFTDPQVETDDLGLANAEDRTTVIESLNGTAVRYPDGYEVLEITELEPWPTGRLTTHAARCQSKSRDTEFMAAVLVAAPDSTVEARQVSRAVSEAKQHLPDEKDLHLIAVGWAFAPDIERAYRNVPVLRIQAHRDLLIGQLQDSQENSSYTLLGEPDLRIHQEGQDQISVEILGYNTYDPATGGVKIGNPDEIDAWMIDTRHNGESFFSHLIYLPVARPNRTRGKPDRRLQAILNRLKISASSDAITNITSTRSQPFTTTEKPVAVKIVTTTGAEMTTVIPTSQIADTARN
ncbi:MAG: DNA methyltransferase [bacterium]|nr:site-specific DNA-methyltransferase [Acidimicrobiia bacterium]MCY4650352.1 DNA methyltransferase [bacterium]